MDFHCFSLVLEVPEARKLADLRGKLWPLYIKLRDFVGPGLDAWMLDAGRIGMDCKR